MFRPRSRLRVERLLSGFLALALLSGASAAADRTNLLLEVTVNGRARHLIGQFLRDESGRVFARADELRAVGIEAASVKPAGGDLIPLDAIADVTFQLDEQRQTISFVAGPHALAVTRYDAGAPVSPVQQPRRDRGVLLNYSLQAAASRQTDWRTPMESALSGVVETRGFSEFGTLSQTAIVNAAPAARDPAALRLDTVWAWSDPATAVTYRAGDVITGGLPWTRPSRLGGVQVQRDFGIRPDLVTLPLPSVTGSAAVPSSLDVYVNGLRGYTQEIEPGPFQIGNLPAVTGAGVTRLVLRDASGRQVETSAPFFVSSRLLGAGVLDYSAEAGVARRDYASESFSYGRTPFLVGSARYGVTDGLTLESHGELASTLVNAGAGASFVLADRGVLSLALAGSVRNGNAAGGQGYLALDTRLWAMTLGISTQRTLGDYRDLASVSAEGRRFGGGWSSVAAAVSGLATAYDFGSIEPPRALDRVTLGVPLSWDGSMLNLTLAHVEPLRGQSSDIVSVGYSRRLLRDATLFVSGFGDLSGRHNAGLFSGLSFPIGGDASAFVGVTRDRGGFSLGAQAARPLRQEEGSAGWRVATGGGNHAAAASYRSPWAQVEMGAEQLGRTGRVTATIDGALTVAGGSVFATPRIADAFAVVKTGAPGVAVQLENRPAGVTDRGGRLLVPDLRSFQQNRLSIDPAGLPLNAGIASTRETVTPADGGGVVLDFGIVPDERAAILRIVDGEGRPLPVGATGELAGGAFVMGYDGKAFVKGLEPHNAAVLALPGGAPCEAAFDYAADAGRQVVIGPITCRPLLRGSAAP